MVDLLVDEAVQRCVALTPPDDGITEPAALRRADGSSVYTVAGADLYTSTRILAAEQRLIADRRSHRRMDGRPVHGRARAARDRRQRQAARPRADGPGPVDGHLRVAAAAGHRPRRGREDHRPAHPDPGLDLKPAVT